MNDLSPRTPLIVKKKRQRRQGRQALLISDRVRVHVRGRAPERARPRYTSTYTPVAPVAPVALTIESMSWKATDKKVGLSPLSPHGPGATASAPRAPSSKCRGSSWRAGGAGTQRRAIFLGVQCSVSVHSRCQLPRSWACETPKSPQRACERLADSHAKRKRAPGGRARAGASA
jgi:hypothetical protein